jgi:CheY-like chemotaxis protein
VWEARSVAEALEEIPKIECDVLISDVSLADGTGWDLMKKLRDAGLPRPPFAIAMSGFGMNADRLKSTAAGFRHHLLKPFNVDDLDAMLEEAARELAA